MAGKVVLHPNVAEGDAGCRVEIREFGIGFGAPTRKIAVYGLERLLLNHVRAIIAIRKGGRFTPAERELAERIFQNGFKFQF